MMIYSLMMIGRYDDMIYVDEDSNYVTFLVWNEYS